MVRLRGRETEEMRAVGDAGEDDVFHFDVSDAVREVPVRMKLTSETET